MDPIKGQIQDIRSNWGLFHNDRKIIYSFSRDLSPVSNI